MRFHKHNAQLAIKLRRAQNHEKWLYLIKQYHTLEPCNLPRKANPFIGGGFINKVKDFKTLLLGIA